MLRTPDGKLVILDFGLMTKITDDQKYGMIEAIANPNSNPDSNSNPNANYIPTLNHNPNPNIPRYDRGYRSLDSSRLQ
jgi:hypothetical protein